MLIRAGCSGAYEGINITGISVYIYRLIMTNIDLVHSFFLQFFGAEKGQSIRVTLHSKDTKTTWVTYWTSRAMAHCILAEDQEGEWKR